MTKSSAVNFCEAQDYDRIVQDVNLPDGNGFDFCKEIKERRSDTAVIFLTANDMESDMLKGFELGADDYVTKPFPISVFRKKVSALLTRIQKQTGGDCYTDGTLSINFSELTATFANEPVIFTPMEYRLLKVLVKNPQIVLTKQVLLEKLCDADENFAMGKIFKKTCACNISVIIGCYDSGTAHKSRLNKIAARWPGKAVAQRFCSIGIYGSHYGKRH